jgi:hypothetical protein
LWDTVRDSAAHGLSDISLPILTGTADPLPTIATLNARMRVLRIMESQLSQLDESTKAPAQASETAEASRSSTASAPPAASAH